MINAFNAANTGLSGAGSLGQEAYGILAGGAAFKGFNLLRNFRVPFGFANKADFRKFGKAVNQGLGKAGFTRTTALLQGSAVTGRSFKTGMPFDVGRNSDFDIALAGSDIFQEAQRKGVRLATKNRTFKLTN